MTTDILLGTYWFCTGVSASLFWWNYQFSNLEYSSSIWILGGILGPIAWPVGYFIHYGRPRFN